VVDLERAILISPVTPPVALTLISPAISPVFLRLNIYSASHLATVGVT
jgi:hypothetical protein